MTDFEIHEFSTLEEATAFIAQQTAEANRTMLPEQRTIDYGSHVVRPLPGGLLILGEIWTEEEFAAGEGAFYDLENPADALEYAAVLRDQAEMHDNGYMLGRWYSTIEPDGEIGSAHRAACWPITAEAFAQARRAHWNCSAERTPLLWTEMEAIPRVDGP